MRNKSSISVTIDPELVKWIDKQIEEKRFANRSHGVEYALYQLKERR
ncbi:MAG: ribbon-helix-helix domain-containing protein [Proteobacteria bacterium]|nr:ribbon-helix-helix domain-containing protein [Pseudomonadota bacterium]